MGQGRILFVDLTQNFMDSMRLEALARILIARGYTVAATTGIPVSPPAEAPFDTVILVPKEGKFIWFCVVPRRGELSPDDMRTFSLLQDLIKKIFQGTRELRGPQQDLWPLLLALEFRTLGILKG